MSNLLPQASIETLSQHISCGDRPVSYEDSFESDSFSIYDLLNLSAMRQKNDLSDRMAYREELVRLLSGKLTSLTPMAFEWRVGKDSFESTSMLFELYMTTLSLGESLLRSEVHYKEASQMFSHAKEILRSWKTTELICPDCPHVCTKEYLDTLLLVTKSSHLLKDMRNGKHRDMVLASAMNFAGQVPFHLNEWSEVALNHYLASRALLFFHLSQKNKEEMDQGDPANASYTAAKEAFEVCQMIDRSKCHMNESLDKELNDLLTEVPEYMQSMRQVFYAVEVPVESIALPASLKNDTKQAGEN